MAKTNKDRVREFQNIVKSESTIHKGHSLMNISNILEVANNILKDARKNSGK